MRKNLSIDLESFGLRSVERDPDTEGGYVGQVASYRIAMRVRDEMQADGLIVSIASSSDDKPGDPVFLYVVETEAK